MTLAAMVREGFAAFFFLKEAGKHVNDNGKVVTLVTSLLGAYTPFYAVYAGTKAAVLAISEALDAELADRDIRVSAVLPSFTDTGLIDGTEATGLMKPIRPDDVAAAVLEVIAKRGVIA